MVPTTLHTKYNANIEEDDEEEEELYFVFIFLQQVSGTALASGAFFRSVCRSFFRNCRVSAHLLALRFSRSFCSF